MLNSNRLSRFRFRLTACLVIGSSVPRCRRRAVSQAENRTITAFVRIEPAQYRQQIGEAVTMLRQAKAAFEKGGYEVQTIRITTQPFTE
jgi:hypothetical protein